VPDRVGSVRSLGSQVLVLTMRLNGRRLVGWFLPSDPEFFVGRARSGIVVGSVPVLHGSSLPNTGSQNAAAKDL